MIRGYCHTSLDGYERENWPSVFAAVPRRDERIVSTSGRNLRVCNVSHEQCSDNGKSEPYPSIIVELNK